MTPVYDAQCGLRVLIGKQKVIFENGVVLDRRDYEDWGSAGTLKKCVADLLRVREYSGFDYAYALETGQLRRKPAAHRQPKPPAVRASLPPAVPNEPLPPVPAPEQMTIRVIPENSRRGKTVFSSALLMTFVMAVVGIGSAVMSAYHTTAFLIQGGKPLWTAAVTGIMLILFSGTAFTAARYFFTEGGAMAAVGILFLAAGLAVIAYSMFSTLSVNYTQFKARDDLAVSGAVADNEALAAHTRLLTENQAELDELMKELTRLEAEAEYWREKSWRRYDECQTAITSLREKREAVRAERKALETATVALVETAAVSRETVYTFLARLAGLPEDAVRFFVYVVPACLYDILAPFALTVVLLLTERRRKGDTEEDGP
jgi:hypothetical protein